MKKKYSRWAQRRRPPLPLAAAHMCLHNVCKAMSPFAGRRPAWKCWPCGAVRAARGAERRNVGAGISLVAISQARKMCHQRYDGCHGVSLSAPARLSLFFSCCAATLRMAGAVGRGAQAPRHGGASWRPAAECVYHTAAFRDKRAEEMTCFARDLQVSSLAHMDQGNAGSAPMAATTMAAADGRHCVHHACAIPLLTRA